MKKVRILTQNLTNKTSEADNKILFFILSQIQINNKQHSASSVSWWDKEERLAQPTALGSKYKKEKQREITVVRQHDIGGITPNNSHVGRAKVISPPKKKTFEMHLQLENISSLHWNQSERACLINSKNTSLPPTSPLELTWPTSCPLTSPSHGTVHKVVI